MNDAHSHLNGSSFINQKDVETCSVVIVGGGVVGATTALLLAQALPDITITLVDAATPQPVSDEHDSRVFAMSLASIELLKTAQVWQQLVRKADYTGMKVWATNGSGELTFGHDQSVSGASADMPLGSMVEPSVIQDALNQRIATQSNITSYYGTKVTLLDNIQGTYSAQHSQARFSPKWRLSLSSGVVLQTALVIAADGRQSFIRQAAAIDVDTLDYKKTAICCAMQTEKPHAGIARQVFLPTGPLALLPLADIPSTASSDAPSKGHWQSVVWTLPTNQAHDLLAQAKANPDVLANALSAYSQFELGAVTAVHRMAHFPLNAMHAQRYTVDGLVLVGDAAHGVHPLAGQGLNLGLLDVAQLTDALLSEWERSAGQVWASSRALTRYEQQRRTHNASMMHSFSAIGWLYEGQNYPAGHVLEWLRSEAVATVSRMPVATHWFGKQASGLPELAKTRWFTA